MGSKPIAIDIIKTILAPDLNALEAKLARNGYGLSSLCELLNAKASEVKTYLRGQLASAKTQAFNLDLNQFLQRIRADKLSQEFRWGQNGKYQLDLSNSLNGRLRPLRDDT